MAYVVKLSIPAKDITEAKANIERLRRVFLAAAKGEADMFELLAWELEGKFSELKTRRIRRAA
jgi:hypothetical protein